MSLLLYGVVRAGFPAVPPGCQRIDWQDLAILARPLPAGYQLAEADALVQLAALSTVVEQGPVVPLKFGAVAADEETVRTEVLAGSAPRLRAQLDRLDGLVEVHLYLRFDEDTALRAVHQDWRFSAFPVDVHTQIRLGELVSDRMVAWRKARADELCTPITALAQEAIALPDRDPTEDRRAFLLPAGRLPAVRAAVARLAGMQAELVGPLPAYDFLDTAAKPASRWGW